jgi:hypothetical protein
MVVEENQIFSRKYLICGLNQYFSQFLIDDLANVSKEFQSCDKTFNNFSLCSKSVKIGNHNFFQNSSN